MHDGLFEAERSEKLPLRLGFIGLWCAADREGRFRWEPRRLGAQIMPYDQIDFSRVMDALATRGFLVKYEIESETFGAIPSWKRHQVINNRERESELPNYTPENIIEGKLTRAPRVTHASKEEGKGREGKGTGENGVDVSTPNDETWFAELSAKPAYNGIDVRREFSKMETWCAANKKQATRRRFINWLNRADKPLSSIPTARPTFTGRINE